MSKYLTSISREQAEAYLQTTLEVADVAYPATAGRG
jgi:hypothetical protein